MSSSTANRFARWQAHAISQLTYSINLFLGLSVASLGFQITTLLNRDSDFSCWQKYSAWISLLALLISVKLGILCVLTRLLDFRNTAQIAKNKEGDENQTEIALLRKRTTTLGRLTWIIFALQIGSFGLGVAFVVLSTFSLIF